jgi:hypothetical protein
LRIFKTTIPALKMSVQLSAAECRQILVRRQTKWTLSSHRCLLSTQNLLSHRAQLRIHPRVRAKRDGRPAIPANPAKQSALAQTAFSLAAKAIYPRSNRVAKSANQPLRNSSPRMRRLN